MVVPRGRARRGRWRGRLGRGRGYRGRVDLGRAGVAGRAERVCRRGEPGHEEFEVLGRVGSHGDQGVGVHARCGREDPLGVGGDPDVGGCTSLGTTRAGVARGHAVAAPPCR